MATYPVLCKPLRVSNNSWRRFEYSFKPISESLCGSAYTREGGLAGRRGTGDGGSFEVVDVGIGFLRDLARCANTASGDEGGPSFSTMGEDGTVASSTSGSDIEGEGPGEGVLT